VFGINGCFSLVIVNGITATKNVTICFSTGKKLTVHQTLHLMLSQFQLCWWIAIVIIILWGFCPLLCIH